MHNFERALWKHHSNQAWSKSVPPYMPYYHFLVPLFLAIMVILDRFVCILLKELDQV